MLEALHGSRLLEDRTGWRKAVSRAGRASREGRQDGDEQSWLSSSTQAAPSTKSKSL